MGGDSKTMPLRQGTTFGTDEAVPEIDPSTVSRVFIVFISSY